MTVAGVPSTEASQPLTESNNAGVDVTDYASISVGAPEARTENRFKAIGEAGANIDRNNQATAAFHQQDVNNQILIAQQKMKFELENRGLDLNDKTVSSQASLTDSHSKVIESLQKQIDALDQSDPQYLRRLGALTNSIASASQSASQANSNITTLTAQGHGSVQTQQSGGLGMNSTTTGQSIDANVATAQISSDTQLGLGSQKVVLDTTLANTQAGVANHHTDMVGAPVAQGQANYYTGIGSNTAGFTNGSNATGNFNSNNQYGLGYNPYGMMGGIPPMMGMGGGGGMPPADAKTATSAIPNGNILSGQIQSLMMDAEGVPASPAA